MNFEPKLISVFSERLLQWYSRHKRDLPWRNNRDPYAIWVSEIMLQQTQVRIVIPYYHRFLKRFPDLATLAQASLDDVLKLWEGLGYYARARNLHGAARAIVQDRDGLLPDTYRGLLDIPGIGPYTAAAVASIAYDEACAVVDGNVVRVLARLLGINLPYSEKGAKAIYGNAADELLPQERAGDYNQALMELGALICTPVAPQCRRCPAQAVCKAHLTLPDPAVLPPKVKKKERPHHDIVVGVVWRAGRFLVHRRPARGLLGGLWEFPGGERRPGETAQTCAKRKIEEKFKIAVRVQEQLAVIQHGYTHFKITLYAFQCTFLSEQARPPEHVVVRWVTAAEAERLAFARSNQKILETLANPDV